MKFSMTVILFFVLFSTASAAEPTNPGNPKMEAAFKNNFPGAHISHWEQLGDVSVAFFSEGQRNFRAYFDSEGVLIAVARITTLEQLPLKVMHAIKKQYGETGDIRLMEVNLQDNSTFYLTELVDKNRICTIKITPEGVVETIKRKKLSKQPQLN
jgi:hypothetical protein